MEDYEGKKWGEHASLASLRALRARIDAEKRGRSFCCLGPPRLESGGSVLDDPDRLWADEGEWTEEMEEELLTLERRKKGYANGFRRKRVIDKAATHWNTFYRQNGDRFFKDRHYLDSVFPELAETEADRETSKSLKENCQLQAPRRRTLLELGCGVGNAVFPLLESNSGLYIVAVDLSPKAIETLKANPLYDSLGRCSAYVCDAAQEELPEEARGMDFVLLQYSMSAVLPKDHEAFALRAAEALKPGGLLLMRDYGRLDEAQLRMPADQRLSDNCYARGDGTVAYFFELKELRDLFGAKAGLEEHECHYIRRQYANRADKKARRRIWVHAKFRKKL